MNFERTEIVNITPEMARVMLEKNIRINRNVGERTVRIIANAIKRGEWRLNGDTIKISDRGNLLDGQHRLHACIKADMPIITFVAYGIDESTYPLQNISHPQGFHDLLKMDGVTNSKQSAAIVNRYFALKGNLESKHGNQALLTNVALLNFYDEHNAVVDYISSQCVKFRSRTRIISGSEVGGIMLFLMLEKGADIDVLVDFFDALTDYTRSDIKAAALLRDVLRKDFESLRHLPTYARMACYYKALKAYLNGKEIRRCTYYEGDESDFNNMQITNQLKIK